MKKQKNRAFNKDIYLLGEDVDGIKYWLEAPSWDCNWYWGFGYVETYTNNKHPEMSKDIESHQHIDSSFLGEGNAKDGGYCHNIYDSKLLHKKTFTESEGWELSELFKCFYLLQKYADFKKHGHVNISPSNTTKNMKDLKEWNSINQKDIPIITTRILEILAPKETQNDN